jgi:hypothetical protein
MKKGGGKKKNKEKIGFNPVEDMIASIGTEFDVLTADSLFGFMITMNVEPEHAEYLGRSRNGLKLNKPITEYLLKVSVIDVTQHYLEPIVLDVNMRHNKSSETAHNFYKEAVLQQRVWLESIVGGSVPVCPDVYNISYNCGGLLFSGERNSFKRRSVSKYPQVYDYLKKYHSLASSAKIGAIAMEYIPNSKTLYEVMIPDVEEEFKRIALINAGAQVIRLFLNHVVVHADLHLGNIIVDETGMSYIIDFGIVLDLMDESSPYYERISPFRLMDSRARYVSNFQERPNRMEPEGDRDDIATTCRQIFGELMRAEMTIFRRCKLKYLFEEINTRDLFYEIGMQYKALTSSSGNMSKRTIDTKIKKGEIELITDVGLGDALVQQLPFLQPNCSHSISDDYYVATNPMPAESVAETKRSSSGGGTKRRTSKKNKKTRRGF